jgi:O-antigen/teichoic acid export membrane protein
MNNGKQHSQQISSRETKLDSNLKKTARGTGILLVGSITGMVLGLVGTILVARTYSVGEYGLFGLGAFILSFFLGISTLGIVEGCPRFISYYRGKKDEEKVRSVIKSSILMVSVSSTIFAILLFFLSDFIAYQIFGIAKLSNVIKIFTISLPFWAVVNLIVSIFRGFESVKERVYFSNFSLHFIKIILFASVIVLGLSFNYIIIAFTLSIVIIFFVAVLYLIKRLPEPIKKIKSASMRKKEILHFSWPLIFSGLGWFLVSGSDRLMLGILTTESEVGLYNAALSLSGYTAIFLTTAIFIFQPIASRLLAENRMDEIKRNYQIITKWLFTLTFPFIMVLFLFPVTIISIFFGEKYILAATSMQLLVIAFFIHAFLGPSGATITILGKTKIIMYFNLIAGCINVVLNYFFIPLFGINGAALSTMISLIIVNGLFAVYLFKISKIHPLRRNFVLPVATSVVFIALFYSFIVFFNLEKINLLFKIISCLIAIIFYFTIIIISKSFDKEDLQLFLLVEKRIGIKFNILRKIIKRFI